MMTLKIQNRPIGGSAFGGQPARDVPRFSERGSGENKTPVDALMRLCLHEDKEEEEKKSTPNSKTKSLLERMLLFALLELSTRKASAETFKKSSQAWTSVSCAF